ncbi:hypothetical protein LEP1GSC186_1768 [Leptospira noguchii serovar Autumnalis str. ZUN142]|uniref:Uncharacterized protein n=1 Tax=Leptospira noguchii serovar Autumnalis str. ZUN142 TaxID=1085540 RepID=M6UWP4_9LEPT|nr:hypothetical protein [Leptospira noguchii]EMO41748.1 hypothetical protein LEP1GSC186_1768 [Leptospira noguchii serovar Autumnalis str. ZUN142]
MSVFLHLTSIQNKNSIFRSGVKTSSIHYENVRRGVFCMPVISDFWITHQWLREIKRFSKGPIIGIYFKIPDLEPVWSGNYNSELMFSTAIESTQLLLSTENKLGFQIVLPRKVTKKEILKIKNLPQTVGWRYFPEAHSKVRCLCPACLPKGWPFANRLKENRYYSLISKFNQSQNEEEKISILGAIDDLLSYDFRIDDYEPLIRIFHSSSQKIKEQILEIFPKFQSEKLFKFVSNLLHSEKESTEVIVENLLKMKGKEAVQHLNELESDPKIQKLINDYLN